MHQLMTEVRLMRPTTSAGQDNISFRMVKDAISELEPLLLNLVNQCIKTTTFPDVLKTTKIISNPKKGQGQDNIGRLASYKHSPSAVKKLLNVS